MPRIVPQEEKTLSSINAQPKNMRRSIIHHILERDLAGWKNKAIAEDVGLTEPRVSVIKNCPAYQGLLKERLTALEGRVVEKVSTHIAGAEGILKDAKVEAANTLVSMMRGARSEAVRASVAGSIVDRGRDLKGGVNVIVQINERLSARMDKVLDYNE